jgi:uncharacterized protein
MDNPQILTDTNLAYFNAKLKVTLLSYSNSNSAIDTSIFIVQYLNGIKILIEKYYETGSLSASIQFNEFGRNGKTEKYFRNGQLQSYTCYVDGKPSGPIIKFYESGEIETIYHNSYFFTDVNYYKNGNVETAAIAKNNNFLNDSRNIPLTIYRYWENGNLSSVEIWNSGKQTYQEFYENGKIALKGYLFNSPKDRVGKWEYFSKLGNLIMEENYNESFNLDGRVLKWDESGKLTEEIYYSNGSITNIIKH